jgi:LCP family protein required for cell wall assembly
VRYLDLDNLPPPQTTPSPARSGGVKPRLGRPIKLFLLIGVLSGLLYGAYALFWPASATLSDIFKAPAAVLSFLRPPENDLKSTAGRTNILLVGIDRRQYEKYGQDCFRSDTMVVASVDLKAKNKDVVMISIPRDLWVTLPSWGEGQKKFGPTGAKINAAYAWGDCYDYPNGGGLGLLRDELQSILDLPIHYAVRVDFYGFKQLVDAVGGVSINVENGFTDCEYPIEGQENNPNLSSRYQCVVFKKGYQYMDSDKALQFVRSRYGNNGEGSDLARARRQQKVMLSVRDKALSLQTLADPGKLSDLIKSLGQTFQTLDVDFSQIGQFYKLVQLLDPSIVQNIVLTNDPTDEAGLLIVPPAEQYDGAFVFIPRAGAGNFKEIQTFIQRKLAEATLKEATSSAEPQNKR